MRARKYILRGAALTLALAALLIAGAFAALKTEWARARIETALEASLNAEIEGFGGSLPFAPRIASLRLRDGAGEWLIAENVQLEWGMDFLPLTWRVDALKAERVHLLRLPAGEGDESGGGFALPRLAIREVSLPRIEIEPPVTGQRHVLAAEGALSAEGGAGAQPQGRIALRALEGPRMEASLAADGNAVTLSWREEPGGALGALIGLPEESLKVDAEFAADGGNAYVIRRAEIALSEDVEIRLEGRVSDPFGAPEFTLKGEAPKLRAMPEALANLAEGPVAFSLSGALAGELRIHSLRVEATHATLTGEKIALGEALSGRLTLAIAQAQFLQPELRGELTATAELGGSGARPAAKIEAALKGDGRELRAALAVEKEGELLRIETIHAETPGMALTGALTYALESSLAEGALTLKADDLSALNPFLAEAAKGTAEAEITLAAAGGKQRAEARGKLENAGYGGIGAGLVAFRLQAADLAAREGIDAEIEASRVTSGETVIDSLGLTAKGSGTKTQLTLNARSLAAPALTLRAEALLESRMPDWTLTLAALQGRLNGRTIALAAPAAIARKEERITLAPLRLNVAKGALQAEGFYSTPRVDLRFALSRLPLSLLTGGEADGRLNGDVRVTGSAAKPSAALNLRAEGLARRLHSKGGFALALTGALKGDGLSLRARLENTEGELAADIRAPAQFSLSPFALSLPPDGRLSGQLRADAESGPLAALLLPDDQTLTGHLKGALELQGTLSAPRAAGTLNFANGRYENLSTGTRLSDMNLRLEARENRLEITQGEARAGEGSVRVSGAASLAEPYPLAFQATLNEAEIIDSREASGVVNGALSLTGDLASPLLAGKLTLGPMNIGLPEGGGVDVPEVKIRNPEALPRQPWQRRKKAEGTALGPESVRLSLDVDAPSRVYVRGRGLETELRGAISVRNNLALPEIEGELRSVRGTFTLLDRRLAISEGILTFRGALPPSPFIRMSAETKTRELTAGIRLEGPVRAPELTLTSTPPRPQDEILAHLLFGRELKSITPFQGLQLAQALQTLRGKGGGAPDLLGRTRNLLGIDRLDVGESDSGEIGVGAGKYISEKIYIGVEGGADPEAGKVKAEIEVSPSFSVETETGGRSSGARFNWKHDY